MIVMWSNDLYSMVFSRVKVIGTAKLKSKYPKIRFTDKTPKSTDKIYPTVVIQELSGSENSRSQDLERRKINGVTFSVQIDVLTNVSQAEANNVAYAISDIMSDMMFDTIGKPIQDNSEVDNYRNVARYRRKIDYDDVL